MDRHRQTGRDCNEQHHAVTTNRNPLWRQLRSEEQYRGPNHSGEQIAPKIAVDAMPSYMPEQQSADSNYPKGQQKTNPK